MTRTPKRFLFLLLAFCIIVIFSLQSLQNQSVKYIRALVLTFPPQTELLLARYYWVTGRPEKAIEEYKKVVENIPAGSVDIVYNDLWQLLLSERNIYWEVFGYAAYSTWLISPKIIIFAVLLGVISIILFIIRHFRESPCFVILPFEDYTGLNLGKNLPEIAYDRIREVIWQAKNVDSVGNFISESLEMPVLSMVSEGNTSGAVDVIETALKFSIGFSDFPLAHLFESIKIWFQHPQFQLRGVVERKNNNIYIRMILVGQNRNLIENVWHIELTTKGDSSINDVVDAIIYPLLFHFNKNHLQATRWESLHALHVGLEEFQRYRTNQYSVIHLENAKSHFEFALTIDPGYLLANYNLSLVLITMGDYDKARQMIKGVFLSENKV